MPSDAIRIRTSRARRTTAARHSPDPFVPLGSGSDGGGGGVRGAELCRPVLSYPVAQSTVSTRRKPLGDYPTAILTWPRNAWPGNEREAVFPFSFFPSHSSLCACAGIVRGSAGGPSLSNRMWTTGLTCA